MSTRCRDKLRAFCETFLDDPERGLKDAERAGLEESEGLVDLLTGLLPDIPDPDQALANLVRYRQVDSLPTDPEAAQTLLLLFGYSPYLADSLVADPAYLRDLLRSRRQGAWGVDEYRNDLARWMGISRRGEPWGAFRSYKKRANLRIALRDLRRAASLPEITREISCAADALVQSALEIVLANLVGRYGRPQSYDESGRIIDATMCILGLGKLGGSELNYSSDIDLLFIYSDDGETTGTRSDLHSQIPNKQFFTLAAQDLATGLGRISEEGQVFRVDCRLRPGGNDGDLVNPLQAAIVYYRTWARSWERQALIKARPIAGSPELGAQFLRGVSEIVYPFDPDPGIVDGIRKIKDKIDTMLSRRGESARHLKLGDGGIREIEFAVQALQILHGGRESWVRESNTLLAMHRLTDKGYLSPREYGALSAAYSFLREAEHRLQLHRNLQQSLLPKGDRETRILARAIGYRDNRGRQEASAFLSDLETHRREVRKIYDEVLGRLSQGKLGAAPKPDLFLDRVSDAAATSQLADLGFPDAASLLGGVKAVSRVLESSSPAIRRGMRRITPQLLAELVQAGNPVRAIRNFERYIASLGIDPVQMERLCARPELTRPLVRLFSGSQLLSSILLHRPNLVLEEGFGLAIARDRTIAEHMEKLEQGGKGCDDPRDLGAFLRVYQRTQILYVGLKELSRQDSPSVSERALTNLAESVLRYAVSRCAAQEPPIDARGFYVLGLGKLGYRELDYSSDLDLVFLYDTRTDGSAERHATANTLATRIVEMLTSITKEGALYSVDNRLRPFGGDGELAQPVDRAREYFATAAGVWELQAFLKARAVAGDLERATEAARLLEETVRSRPLPGDFPSEIRGMKSRLEEEVRGEGAIDIKLGPGGLSAIQFAIQCLQLKFRVPSPPHKRTTRLLATLKGAGLLSGEQYRVFFTGFQFLRKLEHQNRLIHGRAVSQLPGSRQSIEELAVSMGYPAGPGKPAGGQLLQDLDHHRGAIEAAFDEVIARASSPEPVGG